MTLVKPKYWLLFTLHWQNLLTYPVSFMMWRFRQFLGSFSALTFWSVVFLSTGSAFGYSRETMVTYIFLTAFLQSVILSTNLNSLADDIYTGQISNVLLKPISLFWIWISREIADKSTNLFFVLFECGILFAIFKPQIYFPVLPQFLIFLAAVLLGAALLFYIMLLFGTIGFWSQESWGVRFLFYMCIDFTAGKLYPLDILPPLVRQVLFLTPFPYLSYVQTQLFLNKYPSEQITQVFVVLVLWLVILATAFHLIWKRGMRNYGALGR